MSQPFVILMKVTHHACHKPQIQSDYYKFAQILQNDYTQIEGVSGTALYLKLVICAAGTLVSSLSPLQCEVRLQQS